MSEQAAIQAWWQTRDATDRATIFARWQKGTADRTVVDLLPPERRKGRDAWVGLWTFEGSDAEMVTSFHPDLDDFLRAEYEKGLVDE